MVKLRLKRFGRRHLSFYRLDAMDIRKPRNGVSVEALGTYDPLTKDDTKAIQIDTERVKYWLSVGAQPTNTVITLLRKAGVEIPKGVERRLAQRQGSVKSTVTKKAAAATTKAEAAAAASAKKEAAAAGEAKPEEKKA